MREPQFTTEEIKAEIGELGDGTPAAIHYLRRELKRRENAGRPKVSEQTRAEQIRDAQKRFRQRKSLKKKGLKNISKKVKKGLDSNQK